MSSLLLQTACVVWLLSSGLAIGGADDELFHDVRAAHDVSTLPLHALAAEGAGVWLLVRVTPSRHSGFATMTDYRDESGAVRHGLVVVVEGAWRVLAAVNAPTDSKGGDYRWDNPVDRLDRRGPRNAEMFYSPFVGRGGVVLCRHNPGAKGPGMLAPTYVIPPPWEKAVLPAFEFCKKAPEVLKDTEPLDRDATVGLLKGDNPLLSVMAFRRLLECNALAPQMAEAALGSTEAHKRAVVTYMILVLSDEPDRAGLLGVLKRAFDGCEGADEARPLAVGAFAATLLHARTDRIGSPSRALLRDLRTRLTNDGQAKVQDPVLQRIFRVRGLDRQ